MTRSDETHPPPPDGHRLLVDSFPNGVLVLFDADLRYRIVGPETLPFSERNAADMVGKTMPELFPDATADRLEPELRATLDGAPRSFDIEYEERVHHVETRPAGIDGEPFGVLVTQEVTAARETARALERQNERLDQFASMVSHDLRNPLSTAVGRLTLYRETGETKHLDAVEDALERIEELTTDLTALARHDAPTGDVEPVALADVARDAWESIDSRAATLSTDACTVVGDDGQLRALFENLFRNAVGHGGADVTVRVGPLHGDVSASDRRERVDGPEDSHCSPSGGFYVEDTGDGIPPGDRDRVFDHGFTTGYSGTGTGLTIVRRVADAHDLDVALSESAEGGARFEFRARE